MADITVDAKPMAKLPFDPDTIPEAVRKRAAAVDALYAKNGNGTDGQPAEPPPAPPSPEPPPAILPEARAPQPPAPVEATTQPLTSQPAAADQTPPPPEKDANWEHRYLAMKGRYDASQKTIGEMQEQMTQLGNELLQVQRTVTQTRQPPPPPKSYLTEQDVQNYGTDLVDFTRRAAADALAPTLRKSNSRTPTCANAWRAKPAAASTSASNSRSRTTARSTATRAGTNGCSVLTSCRDVLDKHS